MQNLHRVEETFAHGPLRARPTFREPSMLNFLHAKDPALQLGLGKVRGLALRNTEAGDKVVQFHFMIPQLAISALLMLEWRCQSSPCNSALPPKTTRGLARLAES